MTVDYCKTRTAFGRPIGSFQNSRFTLAEFATEVEIARTYLDRSILELNAGRLSATDAAMAKWWTTEMQKRVVDGCLQMFGGYGYVKEYPIERMYRDARVLTIFEGTSQVQQMVIAGEVFGK